MDQVPIPLPSLSSSASSTATPLSSRLLAVIPDNQGIYTLVDQIIERSGLRQSEIADRLGIRKQSVNQYATMRRRRPSVQWLARLCSACGARLMVERPIGNLKPELESAVLTRSRDSFTAASGRPTMTMTVSPHPELTSTSTG